MFNLKPEPVPGPLLQGAGEGKRDRTGVALISVKRYDPKQLSSPGSIPQCRGEEINIKNNFICRGVGIKKIFL